MGWGDSGWGTGAWGAGGGALGALSLLSAVASRENAVQLKFSIPVYTSGINDKHDGLQPGLYAVTPIPGTVGQDGLLARPVGVASVAVIPVPGAENGIVLELTLDRPMTSDPAQYVVAVSALLSSVDLSTTIMPPLTTSFAGVFKEIVPPSMETPTASRDFANPQTLSQAQDPDVPFSLGTFVPDDATHDYAFDQGLTGYKKRIIRRIITRKGGFAHLGIGYGAGVPQQGKKLARAATRTTMAADVEAQIAKEPETAAVRVAPIQDPNKPGLLRLRVFAKTKAGQQLKFDVPIPVR